MLLKSGYGDKPAVFSDPSAPIDSPTLDPIVTGASLRESRFPISMS